MSCRIMFISTCAVKIRILSFFVLCLHAAKESWVSLNVEIDSVLFVFSPLFLASKQHDGNEVLLDNSKIISWLKLSFLNS